ncbi:hypothetical protein TWF718_001548 [Orbilia javanica]|uniref:RING-type domain-containing protein n=1 Tax=Orbilia javanica TaxID=47235 RepID=A0AAN8RHD9_9PEZI
MNLEIILPWNLTEITGTETYDLFLKTYPQLTVYKNTQIPSRNPTPDVVIMACIHCRQPYTIGEKVFVLPCSNHHCFHVPCHEAYVRHEYSPSCPVCTSNDPIPPYENLKPVWKAAVWIGYGCHENLDPAPFAWSESDDWRFQEEQTINPYLPWGNRRRYLKPPLGPPSSAPSYDILETRDRSQASFPQGIQEDLRTGRPRLCQLPYLKYLKERLEELGTDASADIVQSLLNVYLFSDITNAIFIMKGISKHIYLQVRVGDGHLAWFGFREYEYYIMNNIPSLLGYEEIFMKTLEFLSSISIGFEPTLQLYLMAKELKEFDGKVERVEFETREDEVIRRRREFLSTVKPFGEICVEWAYEQQEVPAQSYASHEDL